MLPRGEFALRAPIRSGELRVTALGVYEAEVNGAVVRDHVPTPGWTSTATAAPGTASGLPRPVTTSGRRSRAPSRSSTSATPPLPDDVPVTNTTFTAAGVPTHALNVLARAASCLGPLRGHGLHPDNVLRTALTLLCGLLLAAPVSSASAAETSHDGLISAGAV
ncbi:alpha-L-rhamnosidase N-terminal domain-containing protein [Streptomyces sp. NBC_00258]|uniref:alpha-L-rhamnosidase N-terminal domain-containing protein n=1 Tax=Streptomyces sp. NBC_00258 TaxID=2903642 RepID=UPI003FA720FA